MAKNRDYWKSKIILITGGSSGIGLAAARMLASEGAHVWLAARRVEKLETALEQVKASQMEPGQRHGFVQADLSEADQAAGAVAQVVDQIGVPDVIINNAGAAHPGYVQELTLDIFEWMMRVNYFATLYVTKAALPDMLARGSGHIINVSSVAGFLGIFGYTAYGASKFAVTGFSEALRAEITPCGLKVSIVFPPDTKTPQLDYENQYKPAETRAISGTASVLSPEFVARTMLKQAVRGRYLIFPGFDSRLVYILSTTLPKSMVFLMLDWMARKGSRLQK